MFGDIFNTVFSKNPLSAELHVRKIKNSEFFESKKRLLILVDANLLFFSGANIVIESLEMKEFSVCLNGERNINNNFIHEGIAFFDTEDSKAIKKELDEICEKYFPKPPTKQKE